MSWTFDTLEPWVKTALNNIGYTQSEAELGAQAVTWLQQRGAPGVAAMAQHIDFLSAYQLTPNQGGDASASCPIKLSAALQRNSSSSAEVFNSVRQPLLLLPELAKHTGTVRWNAFELSLNHTLLNIEYERKTLRQVLIEKADVHWTPNASDDQFDDENSTAPSNCHSNLYTQIPARELVYVKTLQHYAGALPPREPLDGAPTTDYPVGRSAKKPANDVTNNTSSTL